MRGEEEEVWTGREETRKRPAARGLDEGSAGARQVQGNERARSPRTHVVALVLVK